MELPNQPVIRRSLAAPSLLDDAQANTEIQHIWEDRRRVLEIAFISDPSTAALACWPEFYREYWAWLKGLLPSPLYTDCRYRIGESALSMVRELPVQLETGIAQMLDAGLNREEISCLSRINEAFMQSFTGLIFDVTFARIGCEGGARGQWPLSQGGAREPKRKKTASKRAA